MKIVLDKVSEQRELWLAMKSNTIGSSEVATVVGMNPYESPLKLWGRKTGKIPPIETTPAMEIGTHMEPIIGKLFGKKMRLVMERANIMACHPIHEWATASPDFWAKLADGPKIVETKFTTPRNRHIWDYGTPDYYMLQLNWQLGVCGINHGYVCGLIGGDAEELVHENLAFSEELFDYCLERAGAFIECVKRDIPPTAIAGESALLAKIQGPRVDAVMSVPSDKLHLVEYFEAVKQARADIDRKKRELDLEYDGAKVQLMELLGNKEYGALPDGRHVVAKTSYNQGYTVEPYDYVTVTIKTLKDKKNGRQ